MWEAWDKLLQVVMINHRLRLSQCLKSAVWPQRGHSQPAKGGTHPPPPYHCTLIPLNPLEPSKASTTHNIHAYFTSTHKRVCLRCTFHELSSIPAAMPTPGHPFPARSFHQPVLCLPAMTRLPWVEWEVHFDGPSTQTKSIRNKFTEGDLSAMAPYCSPEAHSKKGSTVEV